MKHSLHLLTRLMAQPWAVHRDTLRMFTHLFMNGETPALREREKPVAKTPARRIKARGDYEPLNWESDCSCSGGESSLPELPELPTGLTVLLPWGILGRAWSEVEKWYLDPVDVDQMVEEIAETPEGSTVVLWFRSLGGVIAGIPETAAQLRALGKTRRLIAFTDDTCCSASYWLAAQCSEIHATPTADVGSIGVYIALYDYTEYMTKMGVSLELFKAGSMKAMGLDGNPLSDDEAALLQAQVDESYKAFIADVTRNRALEDSAMQGQAFRGKGAAAANLVDAQWPSAAAFFAALGKGKI